MRVIHVPACCWRCGLTFALPFGEALHQRVTFKNVHTTCPRCFADNVIPPGTMEFISNGVRLFEGPDFTRDTFRAMRFAVEDLREGRIDQAEAVRRAAVSSRESSTHLATWLGVGIGFTMLMLEVADRVVAWKEITRPNSAIEDVVADALDDYYGKEQPYIFAPVGDPGQSGSNSSKRPPDQKDAGKVDKKSRSRHTNIHKPLKRK